MSASSAENATPAKHRRSAVMSIHLSLSVHLQTVNSGPLDKSEGMKYFFMIIDRFTGWPEAIPLPDCTTETCARTFIRHWLSRFGVPNAITFNCGPQLTSHLWSELSCLFRISASNMMAYHPQGNGLVECFHQQLKGCLKVRLQGTHWMDKLPLLLLGIWTA